MCHGTGASAAPWAPSIGVRTSSHFTYGLRASRFSTLSRCSAALTGWSGSTSRARLSARRPSSVLRKGTRELERSRRCVVMWSLPFDAHARKVLLGQLCSVEHEGAFFRALRPRYSVSRLRAEAYRRARRLQYTWSASQRRVDDDADVS